MARFTVVLDACVLVPVVLADTLLRIAERELYLPLWTGRILGEARDAVSKVHPDVDQALVAGRFEQMESAFSESLVRGWQPLEQTVDLPDPNDRHVVAAALQRNADALVTMNLRDFPSAVLKQHSLEAIHPDDFLLDHLDLAPRIVLDVLRDQASHTRNPVLSTVDLLARLHRAGVPKFASEAARWV